MRRPTLAWIGALVVCLAALPVRGSVSIYMTPEHLARRSALIVEGVVERTASGYDPEARTLATYVTLRLSAVHRGPDDLERVTLREPGGQVGTLVHEVDAVPDYVPGERVFVFLEPAADGALRTAGMFYGKYRVHEGYASRNLQGQGRIYGGPGPRLETVPVGDLVAVAVTVRGRALGKSSRARRSPAVPQWSPLPNGMDRLVWDGERELSSSTTGATSPYQPATPALGGDPGTISTRFVPMSSTNPARWQQTDNGVPVTIHVQTDGNPLNDGLAAAAEVQRAMAAWTAVPEARVALQLGNDDYDYTGIHGGSPARHYVGTNIVLFGDPYDDISDPTGCAGILAIGGYWRSATLGPVVNNVAFHPTLQLYVIFNDRFECFLGDPDNLAEIAAHELGHGLGFGHSDAPDSIMRTFPYGARGPRLGDDDRDAVHCHYPHTLQVTRPAAGERWTAGTLESIEWTSTSEQGPDPGLLDLEYSTDGGGSWTPIATGAVNDGHHAWVVPDDPGGNVSVRVVRHNRTDSVPAVYPEACSLDQSATFEISRSVRRAGSLPTGPVGGLRLERENDEKLKLSWSPSCSPDADDHAVYEGSLAALRAGVWDHQPLECSAGHDLSEYIKPSPGDRFYLVAPLAGPVEGTYGAGRPPATAACAPREEATYSCQ